MGPAQAGPFPPHLFTASPELRVQLHHRTGYRYLVRALGRLRLEDDLAAAHVPHLGDDGLAREHVPREPDLDRLELLGVVVAVLLEDRPAGTAESAQAVEYGLLEPGHRGEPRVCVQRVDVAGEPVQ